MSTAAAASFAVSVLAALPAVAQDLTLYGGTARAHGGVSGVSHAYALGYMEPVSEHVGVGVLYANEGHHDGHHRDGYGAQVALRSGPLTGGLRVALTAGPYYYFDTTRHGASYTDTHGWGGIYGLAASLPLADRWSLQLQMNRILVRERFDSHVALIGVGYRFDDPGRSAGRDAGMVPARRNEFSLLAGHTVVNSFESQRDRAYSAEYRRIYSDHLDWSVGWLDEGDPQLVRRRGLTAQGWLARSLYADRLRVGVGLGPYLAVDRQRRGAGDDSEHRIAGLVSLTARYLVSPHFHVRATWHRVATDYHRDTDVVLLGLGYRF